MIQQIQRAPSALRRPRRHPKREQGVALLTAILIMVLAAGLAINLLGVSEEELRASGRSRSASNSFYAAEAGIQFASEQLRPPADIGYFEFTLTDGTTVRTGAREDASQPDIIEGGLGAPPPGYSINIGQGFVNETYRVQVTASRTGAPTSEIEVRMGVLTTNGGTY
jgi:Tfp pilus assembly protein PilX